MELYSSELAAAMGRIVTLDLLALPGRADGAPPGPIAVAVFVLRAAVRLAWSGRRYDAVHFGDFALFPLALWTSCVAPRARRTIAVHGLDLIYGLRRGLVPRLYGFLVALARACQSRAGCLIANSAATAGIARNLGFRQLAVVPLGITLPDATTAAGPDSERYILFVGRLVPRKGASWFAEQVLPRLPEDIRFKVVGTPWDEMEVARVRAAPRTQYLGPVPDAELRQLRAGAALMVMPNRSVGSGDIEGFGLAALEAAAAGALLVASGIEGIVDAVADGETGFLLPEGDGDAWVAKIAELLAWSPTTRQDFLAGARIVLEDRYTSERMARDTLTAMMAAT